MTQQITSSKTLEEKLSHFSEDQIRLIMNNIGAIQLTQGCSLGCHFCGFGAEKKVKDYINFDFLKKLIKNYSTEIKNAKPFLYYASDPFDYDFDGHNYLDIDKIVRKECKYHPFVSTAVPKGKEDLVFSTFFDYKNNLKSLTKELNRIKNNKKTKEYKKFLKNEKKKLKFMLSTIQKRYKHEINKCNDDVKKPNIIKSFEKRINSLKNAYSNEKIKKKYIKKIESNIKEPDLKSKIINRISISNTNGPRIKRFVDEKKWLENQVIIECECILKDEKYYKEHLNEWKDKEDSKWIIYGTFIDENYVNKLKSIFGKDSYIQEEVSHIDSLSSSIIRNKKKCRLPIYALKLPNNKVLTSTEPLDKITDIIRFCTNNLENHYFFEKYSLTKKNNLLKLGSKNIDNLSENGIACFHGVLITPKGIYNIEKIKPSKEYPYGQIITEITPENFQVAKLKRIGSINYDAAEYIK